MLFLGEVAVQDFNRRLATYYLHKTVVFVNCYKWFSFRSIHSQNGGKLKVSASYEGFAARSHGAQDVAPDLSIYHDIIPADYEQSRPEPSETGESHMSHEIATENVEHLAAANVDSLDQSVDNRSAENVDNLAENGDDSAESEDSYEISVLDNVEQQQQQHQQQQHSVQDLSVENVDNLAENGDGDSAESEDSREISVVDNVQQQQQHSVENLSVENVDNLAENARDSLAESDDDDVREGHC